MLHIKGTKKVELNTGGKTAVALGKFDGIHCGHMLLMDKLRKVSNEECPSVVFTFDYQKNSVFDIDTMKNIYTSEEKAAVLETFGVDILLEYPFDNQLAAMKPEKFIEEILVSMLHAGYIIVGEDFRFGKNRTGDVALLKKKAAEYAYEVIAIPKMTSEDGKIISSTIIREQITVGNMEKVIKLLGRPYSITGTVEKGKQLGRTIGIPTANVLPVQGKIYPPPGVYATRIKVIDETSNIHDALCRRYKGITNIGDNPTVNDDGNITIETNIFDFNTDIYGKQIKIEFISYIRPEMKFGSINQLKKQMNKDIMKAQDILLF